MILLEADAIGAGAAAGSAGLIREDLDASFRDTAAAHGLRTARALWEGFRRASLDITAALKRSNIKCDAAPMDLLHIVRRDPDEIRALRREYEARREAGIDHSWVTPAVMTREAAIETGGAIRTRGASLDPYRACIGLASVAAARGAALYEHSPVRRIRAGRKQVEVTTEAGVVRAESVVVATGAPLADLRALRRHLRPHQGYAVVTEPLPAGMRREVGRRSAALTDSAHPPHLLRWMTGDRILFSGADQDDAAPRSRDKILQQRTGQLMYELSVLYPAVSGVQPAWAWDVTRDHTVDGLPFIGPHRNFPRHLFALGEGRHGAAFAWLAARILLRQFQGEPAKGDEAFGFARIL